MPNLDNDARLIVEKNLDTAIDNPEETERGFRNILLKQGIEPTLETVLSYLMGYVDGLVAGYYQVKYQRFPNQSESEELSELLKRRTYEVREAFVGTRIE